MRLPRWVPRRYVVTPSDQAPFVVWTNIWPVWLFTGGRDVITIYDVVFTAKVTLEAETVAHEAEHVRQWRQYKWRFVPKYLHEHREHGYAGNLFEQMADEYARQHAHLFRPIGKAA